MSIKNTCHFGRSILLFFFLALPLKNSDASASSNEVENLIKRYRSGLPTLHPEEGAAPEKTIMLFMRALSENPCKEGEGELTEKIKRLMGEKKPLSFVIPGFPFKSMNPGKVVASGEFDLAEIFALETLDHLCREIEKVYDVGARVSIVPDAIRITAFLDIGTQRAKYQATLSALLPSEHISVLQLQDFIGASTTGLSLREVADHLSSREVGKIDTTPFLGFVRSELKCDFYEHSRIEREKPLILAKIKGQKTFRTLFPDEKKKSLKGLDYDGLQSYLKGEILKEDEHKGTYQKILNSLEQGVSHKTLLKRHVKECATVLCEENRQFGSYVSEYFDGYADHIRLSVNPRSSDVSQKFFFPLCLWLGGYGLA